LPHGPTNATLTGSRSPCRTISRRWGQKSSQTSSIASFRSKGPASDAAAQGDRSENAEYIYGKKRLREIDRRIRFITKRLDGAVVVRQEEASGRDDVRFGALVEVADESGKVSRYRIVGPDEADPSAGRISFQSPLGKSLMKRRVGDTVTVQRPAGELELEVRSIRYD
jgi:transcription elongation factor GreB